MTPKQRVAALRSGTADMIRRLITTQGLNSRTAALKLGALQGAVGCLIGGDDQYVTLDELLTWRYILEED